MRQQKWISAILLASLALEAFQSPALVAAADGVETGRAYDEASRISDVADRWTDTLRHEEALGGKDAKLRADLDQDGITDDVRISYAEKEGSRYIEEFRLSFGKAGSSETGPGEADADGKTGSSKADADGETGSGEAGNPFVLRDYDASFQKVKAADVDRDGKEELLLLFDTHGAGGEGTHDLYVVWPGDGKVVARNVNATDLSGLGLSPGWVADQICDMDKVVYDGGIWLLVRQYVWDGEGERAKKVGSLASIVSLDGKADTFDVRKAWLEKGQDGTGKPKALELTADDVEALSSKRGALTIEDLSPFLDLSPLEKEGSLFERIPFSYDGKRMYLQVSASDKDLAAARYEGDLDGAVVIQEEFTKLETPEDELAYEGSCADIRSGNLRHILDGAVTMQDYLTVDLPSGYAMGSYKYWMGTHGGAAILQSGTGEEATTENAGLFADKPLPGGIEIWGAGDLGQGLEKVGKMPSTKSGGIKIRREAWQTDQGTKWLVAYTEKEGASICYCLYLNAELFTEEEFLKISGTMQLRENAIY